VVVDSLVAGVVGPVPVRVLVSVGCWCWLMLVLVASGGSCWLVVGQGWSVGWSMGVDG
jgi:hypothetical protein